MGSQVAPTGRRSAKNLQLSARGVAVAGRGRGRGRRGPAKPRRKKSTRKAPTKDPLFVDGERPRPLYVDYKNVDILNKLTNRHGRIVGRRKSGCTAVSQHAVTTAIKRARFMALMPYVSD
jgi:small subunit ribosomal protein S18